MQIVSIILAVMSWWCSSVILIVPCLVLSFLACWRMTSGELGILPLRGRTSLSVLIGDDAVRLM